MKYKILFTFAVVMITALIASWDNACARDPQIVGGADTPVWASGITVSNGYAYVADRGGGLQVFDVSFPTAPIPVHNVYERIHWAPSDVVVSDGYAFTASTSAFPDLIGGLYVYDVFDPASPRVVASAGVLPPTDPGGVHTYDIELSGAFAYVAAYLEGLLIFDISSPTSPVMVANPPMPSAVRGLDVAGSYAYLADWENGLSILDISNPSSPVLLGSLDVRGIRSTDVAVAGAYAYLVDWETGLHVIDISTPAAPVLVTTLTIPTLGNLYKVELSGPYAYVVGGSLPSARAGLYIVDISTPSAPLLAASLDPPESEVEWHSWSDIHLYGPYVFVAAGPAGFRVIDPGDYRPQRGSDLSITKSGAPNPVPVGDRLTYILDVTNYGPETATGVTVRDTLPPQVNLVSANSPAGSCSSPIGNEITCGLNDLPSGGSTEIQIVVTPTAEARLLNQAVVSGNEVDPILVNNEVALHTTACRVDLAVKVYHRPEPVPLGAYLAYTVTVTNNGYVDADGVVLTDTFPGSVEFLAAAMPKEVGYCSPPAGNQVQCFIDKLSPRQEVTATVVVRTTAEGRLGNTASVSGGGSDCNPTDNTSTTYATVGTLLVRDIPAAWSPQLAVDSEGHGHVASVDVDSNGDTHLLYSTNVSGQWVTRALGDDVSLDAFLRGSQAIAVDSAGHVHISYFSDERFRYASNASGIWSWRTLDFADMKIGIAASAIAVDNQDKVHAVFCDDDACDYFTNRSGSWQGEPAGCAGRAVAIALDSNDVPHLSCHQRGWVWYSTQSGDGTWERDSVDVGCCQCEAMFTSIALDALDRPHLSYTAAEDPNCLSQQEVAKYALLDNGSWAITDLDDGEFYSAGTAVTVDIEDKVHVPYYYKPSETLKYAVGSDGTWDSRHVQGIGFSEARFGSSAAADRSGHVHFVFEEMQRDGTSQARYAWTLALADRDHDNVGDSQEKGPAGDDDAYDGNQDGIADGQQENVASLHCYDQRYYVTLVSPAGTVLAEVGTTDNPSPADAPPDDEFPYGFYDFIVYGVDAGGATTVTLILPAGENPTTYWKYGPTPGNPTPHWYEFLFDGQTGAEITGNVIVLHFVDGGRGDDDLTANGIIIDQGAPAIPAAAQPGAATLISPIGTITDNTPTYTWNAVETATWYYLWVNDSTGTSIKKWNKAGDANCSDGTGECSVTPATALPDGSCKWWVRTWNDYGYGPWSDAMTFTVDTDEVPPEAATLISPNGAINENNPTYTWNAVENSPWYYLWVNDSTGNKIKQWYRAEQAKCGDGSGECSVKHTTVLADGSCKWWVQTWNEYGYGRWSTGMSFTVDTGAGVPPGAATLISPAATITDSTPTYSWEAVENATWYYLWVDDSTGNRIKKWYRAEDAGCADGITDCSVTPDTELADGAAKWWIQTWNDYGYGPWSIAATFSVSP